MTLSSFCDGFDESTCNGCSNNATQHPCWFAKVTYWQSDGNGLVLSEQATSSQRKSKINKPPKPPSGSEYWQSIPTDERGMPYLDKTGAAMTQKELSDFGSARLRGAKEYQSAGMPGAQEAIQPLPSGE